MHDGALFKMIWLSDDCAYEQCLVAFVNNVMACLLIQNKNIFLSCMKTARRTPERHFHVTQIDCF